MKATRTAVGLFVAFLAFSAGVGEALRVFHLSGEVRAFVVCAVLTGIVVTVAPVFGSRGELGLTGPRQWREVRLFLLPALLAVSPLILGVAPVSAGRLGFLTVGYALTGVMEELMWRGVVQRVLGPLGAGRAVLLAAALFGLAHLGNLVYRDSPALVLAQAWGAFCFGVGYGALRHRTGTLVPLIGLHFVTDLAAAVGAVPEIPVLVAQDVVLLGMGLWLLRPPPGPAELPSDRRSSTHA